MRWILATLIALVGLTAQADNLIVLELSSGKNIAVRMGASGSVDVIGMFDAVTVIKSTTPPPPVVLDEPTGPGQLICVRPWSCTLDESDADLTIRESIDAAKSTIPYLRLLPGTPDEQLQPHPAERYRGLVADQANAWVFHVVPTKTTPRILHQGPLDADAVLGWVKVPKLAQAFAAVPIDKRWLDVDFSKQQGEFMGAIELPPLYAAQAISAAVNVKTLPGFKPIPKSEWAQWVSRFPVSRLANSIRNVTEQSISSCVGHACANEIEAGCYMMGGDWLFRRISGMSMYKRIGRSAGSGAYIPDAADEIFSLGILPVTGEPYTHTFSQDSGWSTPMPSGWESTGRLWKAVVYSVDDQESGFRVGMDWRLGRQIGRKSHSINAGGFDDGWWYENSWGKDWGAFGKSVGYDSTFYSGFVYQPVLRDEIKVLMARELPALRAGPQRALAMQDAAKEFHDKIRAIMEQTKAAESKKE